MPHVRNDLWHCICQTFRLAWNSWLLTIRIFCLFRWRWCVASQQCVRIAYTFMGSDRFSACAAVCARMFALRNSVIATDRPNGIFEFFAFARIRIDRKSIRILDGVVRVTINSSLFWDLISHRKCHICRNWWRRCFSWRIRSILRWWPHRTENG